MILIGLHGRMHSGKDTAFEIIRDTLLNRHVERICFADKMKLSGMRALGFDCKTAAEAVPMADVIKEQGFVTTSWHDEMGTHKRTVSGRRFWQLYGTEAHREVFGDDFWVDQLLPWSLESLLANPGADVVVETTTRFQNEAKRILDCGGYVWHIDANQRLGPLPPDAPLSEQPLPSHLITHRVPNNTTIEQFQVTVRSTLDLMGAL